MPQFYIVSETTEDRFDCIDNMPYGIRIARELAKSGQAGDPVCIEHEGKNIRQFVLMPNGRVEEEQLVEIEGL